MSSGTLAGRATVASADGGRDLRRLARMAAALLLAVVAQSEGDAGRTGNCLALFAIAAALYLWSRPPAPFARRPAPEFVASSGWYWLLAGLGVAVVLGGWAFALFADDGSRDVAWRLYLLALVALVAAVSLARDRAQDGGRPVAAAAVGAAAEPSRRVRVWLVTAILVWAAFMRLYRLDTFPAGIFHDEAVNALDAKRVLVENWHPTYFPDNFGRAPLYEYLLAGTFRLAGVNAISMRLPSVFVGVLTVAVFYYVARRLYSFPVAALATLLLASSSWHANFSRIAFDAVLAPLFVLLCLSALLRAWGGSGADRAPWPAVHYLMAGVWLGLGLLTYQAFRLVPLLVIAAFALVPDGLRGHGLVRGLCQGLAGLAIVAVAAAVSAVPLLRYAASEPKAFWERTRTASVLKGRTIAEAKQDILESAAAHLLMFNVAGDNNGRHNLPGEPMLHPLAGSLLVLGMAGCIAGWRRYPARLLLAWFAVMLAAGVMSLRFEAPHALRTLPVTPAVFMIAALPLQHVWLEWQRTFGRRRSRALLLPVVVGVLWLLGGTYRAFFVRQAGDYAVWNAFSTAETRMAQRIAGLGDGWKVCIDPMLAHHPVLRLLAPTFVEPDPYVAAELLPLTESGSEGVVIFVGEQDQMTRQLIEQWYPAAAVDRYENPADGHVTLYEYRLTASQVEEAQGLEMIAAADVVSQTTMGALPEWEASEGAARPVSIIWQGVLFVPETGDYSFRIETPGEGRLLLDSGSILMPPRQREATVHLAEGRHSLWLQVMPADGERVALTWRMPGGSDWVPIDRRYLYHWPIEAGGLQGDYFAGEGEDWASPTMSRIDASIDFYFHVLPMERPYRVRWHGWLTPPFAGEYTLSLSARDKAELWLNGTLVLATAEPDVPVTATVSLATPVTFDVRFCDQTGYTNVHLRWTRPDGIEEPIPYTALSPPPAVAQ